MSRPLDSCNCHGGKYRMQARQ